MVKLSTSIAEDKSERRLPEIISTADGNIREIVDRWEQELQDSEERTCTYLDLSHCRFTRHGLEDGGVFKEFLQREELSESVETIVMTCINSTGAREDLRFVLRSFAMIFSTYKRLKAVHLDGDPFRGYELIDLAPMLRNDLRCLTMTNCLGMDGFIHLLRELPLCNPNLETLKMDDNVGKSTATEVGEWLATLKLEEFSFCCNYDSSGAICSGLDRMDSSRLTHLELFGCIDGSDCTHVGALLCSGCISRATKLQYLDLSYGASVDFFKALSGALGESGAALTHLLLNSFNSVNDAEISVDVEVEWSKVGALELCGLLAARQEKTLATKQSLEQFSVSLKDAFVDSGFLELPIAQTLEHLELHGNNLGDEGVEVVTDFFAKECPKLQYLDLGDNGIGSQGALALIRHRIPPLKTLLLEWNDDLPQSAADQLKRMYEVVHVNDDLEENAEFHAQLEAEGLWTIDERTGSVAEGAGP